MKESEISLADMKELGITLDEIKEWADGKTVVGSPKQMWSHPLSNFMIHKLGRDQGYVRVNAAHITIDNSLYFRMSEPVRRLREVVDARSTLTEISGATLWELIQIARDPDVTAAYLKSRNP